MVHRFGLLEHVINTPPYYRKRHLAIGLVLAAFIGVLYYIGDGLHFGNEDGLPRFFFGQPYHELVLFLYTGIVIYLTFSLRTVFGLAFCILGVLIILPHALVIPAYPDPIYRLLSWLAINVLLALIIGAVFNLKDRQKQYLRDIINTQESERHRLSRELHDETAQLLIDIGHDVDDILESGDRLPETTMQQLQELRENIDDILEKTRRAIQGLQPPLLEELGIKPALYWLCGSLEEEANVEVEPDFEFPENELPLEIKIALFRVIQESLNNIKKHARANDVKVTVRIENRRVILDVVDDGVGFTPVGRGKQLSEGKHGIVGVQERVGLLDGIFTLRSKPGEGTMIHVEIPFAGNKEKPAEDVLPPVE